MFKKIDVGRNLRDGVIAGVAFSICVFLYIRETSYADTWLIYVGSFLFFITILADIFLFNRRRGKNANTVTMIFSSHVTTIIGIIVSCLLSFILLSVMIPGYLNNGPAATASHDTPINEIHDKTNGLSWRIFIGATLINFCFGSFAGFMFPFTIKRNQTTDSGEPYPAHDRTNG